MNIKKKIQTLKDLEKEVSDYLDNKIKKIQNGLNMNVCS